MAYYIEHQMQRNGGQFCAWKFCTWKLSDVGIMVIKGENRRKTSVYKIRFLV